MAGCEQQLPRPRQVVVLVVHVEREDGEEPVHGDAMHLYLCMSVRLYRH